MQESPLIEVAFSCGSGLNGIRGAPVAERANALRAIIGPNWTSGSQQTMLGPFLSQRGRGLSHIRHAVDLPISSEGLALRLTDADSAPSEPFLQSVLPLLVDNICRVCFSWLDRRPIGKSFANCPRITLK